MCREVPFHYLSAPYIIKKCKLSTLLNVNIVYFIAIWRKTITVKHLNLTALKFSSLVIFGDNGGYVLQKPTSVFIAHIKFKWLTVVYHIESDNIVLKMSLCIPLLSIHNILKCKIKVCIAQISLPNRFLRIMNCVH